MKKIVLNTVLLLIIVVIPVLVSAQMDVQVRINIPLPPPIVFSAPPAVVVIPETDIYAIPDVHDDIFFYDGWWWRPWEGRWYRSRHYDRGWAYYNRMPSFQRQVPHNWRQDYRDRRWKGHSWDSRAISYRDAEKNWRSWKQNKHWKNENYWGVRGMDRIPPGQQKKYQRGPDNLPKGEGYSHGKGHGKGQGKKDQRD